MMLSKRNRPLNHWERFWRVASEPLYYLQVKDVYKDVDEMIVSKGMNSCNYNNKISVADFCEWFAEIHPWNQFLSKAGELNIKRLFDIVGSFVDCCRWE